VSTTARADDAIEIVVADAGADPARRERVFEPFFTTRGGPTAVGLAIARSLVSRRTASVRVVGRER
jgi:signal transduction histidine kinase